MDYIRNVLNTKLEIIENETKEKEQANQKKQQHAFFHNEAAIMLCIVSVLLPIYLQELQITTDKQ